MSLLITPERNSPLKTARQTPVACRRKYDLLFSPQLHLAVLAVLVLSCFNYTLAGYFMADDFGELSYVHNIFQGQPWLFWSNWTGNYMQVAGMSVYRPWLLVSLVVDYLIWGVNPFGYYLTNLLTFTGVVLSFYLVTRELCRDWPQWRRAAVSFFSAAIFAVSPLHCESISWVVGRVDVVCCLFYLCSLYFMLKSRSLNKLQNVTLGILCFCLALLTKEMAIGLPVLITCIGFLWPDNRTKTTFPTDTKARITSALSFSLLLWITTAAYFAIRYCALGTFLGGYSGGIGTSMINTLLERWSDPYTLVRLAYPLNNYLYHGDFTFSQALTACYIILAAIASFRLISGNLSPRWFLFMLVWLFSTALPIYQLWGLGHNLEGARFFFFLTLPLSLLLPLLIFQPPRPSSQMALLLPVSATDVAARTDMRLAIIGAVTLALYGGIYFMSANTNNRLWVSAGREVQAVKQSCERLAASAPGRQFILLGIPDGRGGAHMILNGMTLQVMLQPPFTAKNIAESFLTFQPVLFGPTNYINGSRLKQCLSLPQMSGPYVWSSYRKDFVLTPLDRSAVTDRESLKLDTTQLSACQPHSDGHIFCAPLAQGMKLWCTQEGDGILFPSLDLNPMSFDFLEFELRYAKPYSPPRVKAVWNFDQPPPIRVDPTKEASKLNQAVIDLPASSSNEFQKVRIPLSHFWHWYAARKIKNIVLQLFPSGLLEVKNVCLKKSNLVSPDLRPLDGRASPTGVYQLRSDPLMLALSDNAPKGAIAELEVTKANFFFDNVPDTQKGAIVATRIRVPANSRQVQMPRALFADGYQEIRAHWIDGNGNPIGVHSEALTVLRN